MHPESFDEDPTRHIESAARYDHGDVTVVSSPQETASGTLYRFRSSTDPTRNSCIELFDPAELSGRTEDGKTI